ncbi:MAG: SAM-dependent methyltransferase [Hyphomicrobiaceae bacterium]|nr:SAM-dependent methyltransferase [Hyphomicrobiaceae bacterium]
MGDATIEVAAFAGRPFDNWSACLAVVDLNGDSKRSASKAQHLGAASVFVCGPQGVDWYGLGAKGPTTPRNIKWADVPGLFREHKKALAPSTIYDAKLRRPGAKPAQMWFFDAGLMPAVEKNRGDTLLRLVENAIGGLHSELGAKLDKRQAQEDVYRTVFWQLAAKVLYDKGVPNFKQIDLTDVDQVFDRIGKHHGVTDRFPPFGKEGRPAINAMARTIAECGSLRDVSSEAIAYVYENALLDKAAGKGKPKTAGEPYDIRKELGIHSTPSVLIHHMLSQMWGMVEEIAPDDRVVFEPACGHAPFLTGAMRWLRSWDARGRSVTDHDYMRKHVRGVEADAFAIELAKLALTLADEPHGNSWAIQPGDMFAPGVLAKEAKRARILLANPPYEAFDAEQKRRYAKLGEPVTANTKAVEMLRRTLPNLTAGSVFGVVMPVGVLHDKESKTVREELLRDFELSEISVFADNLFEHGDHEVAVLMGRKKRPKGSSRALTYRRVREEGMAAFKERLSFSWEREVLTSRLLEDKEAVLWIPEFDDLWFYLASWPTLDDYAVIGQGLAHKGRGLSKGSWTIRDPAKRGDTLGFAGISSDLTIFSLPALVGVNVADEVLLHVRFGLPYGRPQVLLNYAPVARKPWRLKAILDDKGHALTSRFSAIRPREGGPSALYLWAVLNSPMANAFAYDKLGKRDILVGTMRMMPVPPRSSSHEAAIEQTAMHYRTVATAKAAAVSGTDTLFSRRGESATPVPTDADVRSALLAMDDAVLRAYGLSPVLEDRLLGLFAGVERKGVGLDGPDGRSTFLGYDAPKRTDSANDAGKAERYGRVASLLKTWANEPPAFDRRVFPKLSTTDEGERPAISSER